MVLLRKMLAGVLLAALLLFASACGGPDASINQARLDEVRAGIHVMVQQTAAGRVDAGEEAFWEVHPFFHEVDPLLRDNDWPLAVLMWENMIKIELQYAGDPDPEVLVEEGRTSLQLLPRVADALGLEESE